MTQDDKKTKMQEITERLEAGVKELFESERYKEYLKVMSKFHNYSFNNTMLIALQKPDATLVAGYAAWKKNFEMWILISCLSEQRSMRETFRLPHINFKGEYQYGR